MDNKFYLVWEDNPDTPITAQNLSKSIDKHSDSDRMLFWDFNDSYLKLKANSKASISVPVTNAMFKFEETLASHNGKYNPTSAENITYRFETTEGNSRSIALETRTQNFFSNPSFETIIGDMPTGWTRVVNGASTISTSNDALYGDRSIRIKIDNAGSLASLWQTASTLGTADTRAAFSFYYKSDYAMKLLVIGDPGGMQKFWRPFGVNEDKNKWELFEATATIDVPASSEWTRYEIKGIETDTVKLIQAKFFSSVPAAEYFIDAIQLENKPYCSSYTESSRGDSKLIYDKDILSLDEGSIDLIIRPKYLNPSKINTIFVCPTIASDAIKLKFDTTLGNNLLTFAIYDTYSSSMLQASLDLAEEANFIDKDIRVICNWKKSLGISIYAKYAGTNTAIRVAQNPTPYTPTPLADLLGFDIGSKFAYGTNTEFFEGLVDKFKVNNYITSNTDITNNIDEYVSANNNVYRLFENSNIDLIMSESMLDDGTAFLPNRNYYVWLSEVVGMDSCDVVISLSKDCPEGRDINTSRLIGGFKTDVSGFVEERTIWDLVSKYSNLLVERLVTYNPSTKTTTFEIHNTVSDSTITVNAPITSNRENVFNSPNTYNDLNTFNGDVVVTSKVEIDQIRLQDGTISGINSNLILTNATDKNISLVSSPTGKLYLDKLNIKDEIISVLSGSHLTLTTPTGSASKIILNAAGGANDVESRSNIAIIDNKKIYFNSQTRQMIDLGATTANGIGLQSNTVYMRSAKNFAWFKGGVHSDSATTPGSGGEVLAALTDGEIVASSVSTTSRFYAGRIHNAVYNDLAECWDCDGNWTIAYGMVAVQTTHGIKPSQHRAEKGTVGIVSDSYGFLLNDKGFKEDLHYSTKAPICIAGRAKVRVYGNKIEIGDEVVSYKDGMAIKASWVEKVFKRDRIIGQIDSYVSGDIFWVKVK